MCSTGADDRSNVPVVAALVFVPRVHRREFGPSIPDGPVAPVGPAGPAGPTLPPPPPPQGGHDIRGMPRIVDISTLPPRKIYRRLIPNAVAL